VSCPQPEACCYPDDSCQEELPDDCSTNGGVPQGTGTVCDPNPCPCTSIADSPWVTYPETEPVCISGAIVGNAYDLIHSAELMSFHIQDQVGISGLTVFGTNEEISPLLAVVSAGDEIEIRGTKSDYYGTQELIGPFTVTYLSSPGLPAPFPVWIADLMDGYPVNSQFLSTLIVLQNIEFDAADVGSLFEYGNYIIHDAWAPDQQLVCRIANGEEGVLPIIGTPIPAGPVDITGVCAMHNGEYQVQPRVPGEITPH
jgi:hypothetical protein